MRIFLAGATGAVGRRLASLLCHAGHEVTGTTRTAAKIPLLREVGVVPVVVDVFDAGALAGAVVAARPDIVIHQLTDLLSGPGTPGYPAAQEANRRMRIEGTGNLMQAAKIAGVRRAVAQSIAFVYAPGNGMRDEGDPLDLAADDVRALTVQGIVALEHEVLATAGIDGVVLRYGYFYGPDTWYELPPKPPSVHIDAAAHAAFLAVTQGSGVYNIAEDCDVVSSAKAKRELGFDPSFRMN
ncbi:NAD(P)-dependent oxidoreductase [Afipia sp. GAS231]|uniref:NAD-dependent epimerase/dehydratase family protein n=1 Tax=Afipia sp. GAS231 TaxID=1882747 RepID=UPI00087B3061|nr:NAD(P)-dependent oxidoreductase [Afipia sp. GAS231]SDP51318.1 Nucleoside-diphosphate-sugar epimerase [Afipia sp. GAS231]